MGALRIVGLALALVVATPARADSIARWRPIIAEASVRFGVPPHWIERVMRAESGGRTTLNGRPITSSAGAMGLMQLMPGTWSELRRQFGLGADPHDPRANILAGTAYLSMMYERFGYPGLFAAYNAGPGRYADHLATGRPLPGETRAYLVHVAGAGATASRAPPQQQTRSRQDARTRTESSMFFVLRREADSATAERVLAEPDRLFAIRRGIIEGGN